MSALLTRARLRVVGNSRGLPVAQLRAGEALVLHAPPSQATQLAQGVLLDDWLDVAARRRLDSEAVDLLVAWTASHRPLLTVAGIDLGWIHEGELFGDVFLRELRVIVGLRAALAGTGAREVALERVDDVWERFLRAELARGGVSVVSSNDPVPSPPYPVVFATSIGSDSRVLGPVRRLLGVPAHPRGRVLVKPFRHLDGLWDALARVGAPAVLDPFDRPPRRALETARIAAAGGWVGHPGWRRRRRARALVRAAVSGLRDESTDPLQELICRRAGALLEQRAPENVAATAGLRSALARSRVTAAVMPSDGSAAGRVVLAAASQQDVRTVHVQHGFFSDAWRKGSGALAPFIDGLAADRAAVWSERQGELIGPQARGQVAVTGNPSAEGLTLGTRLAGAATSGRRAVLLVQPPVAPSAVVDIRSPVRQARTAMAALQQAGFTELVLRPHGLDPCGYEQQLAAESDLSVSAARGGPIGPVLESATACIGGVSTGTLEAAAAGVPTVFLESLGGIWPWPLDGSPDFPAAVSADELAERLLEVTRAPEPPGREAAATGLGVREDALGRVLDQVLGD